MSDQTVHDLRSHVRNLFSDVSRNNDLKYNFITQFSIIQYFLINKTISCSSHVDIL